MSTAPGRNAPCPCGSGKKYKKCCLDKERSTASSAPTKEVLSPSRGLGAPPDFGITPYSLARMMSEDPAKFSGDGKMKELLEYAQRHHWTIDKIAAMTTEAIEEKLRAYGVEHSRERFLRLAAGRFSAWSLSEVWRAEDPLTFKNNKDEDFLGLAACELWKRWLPERPSVEMLDDWMQQGYQRLYEHDDSIGACDWWWRFWQALYPHLEPTMRTMESVASIFRGTQSVFNWAQDFEVELGNASMADRAYAQIGRSYCEQWIERFTEESASHQVSIRRTLARFLFRFAEPQQAEALLLANIERWPTEVWGYVALADAYSHLFRGDSTLPLDIERATDFLRQGLQKVGTSRRDREVLEERLQELA